MVESVKSAVANGQAAADKDAKYRDLSSYLNSLPDDTNKWGYDPRILTFVVGECHRLGLDV